MHTIDVGFLGYGTRALDALMEHPGFNVKHFIAPKSRLNEDVYRDHEKFSQLPFEVVDNNKELEQCFLRCWDVEFFIMNACPIILKKEVLDIMPVYNIHPGDIRYNRGHQPHMWTILLGEQESCITLHKVTPRIDDGTIISFRDIQVTDRDDAMTVLDRLEDKIPYLLDELHDHITRGRPPVAEINNGGYRRVMTYEDYRIDFSKAADPDFIRDTDRKIRARATKHGAFFYALMDSDDKGVVCQSTEDDTIIQGNVSDKNTTMIYVDRLIRVADHHDDEKDIHLADRHDDEEHTDLTEYHDTTNGTNSMDIPKVFINEETVRVYTQDKVFCFRLNRIVDTDGK